MPWVRDKYGSVILSMRRLNNINSNPEKFRGKYRIKSARLPGWDYGQNGCYYVTICTKDHAHFFGEIVNGKMKLSAIGRLIEKFWFEIPRKYSYIKLDAFVVMPNHIHGIIIIDKPDTTVETPKLGVSTNGKKWKPGVLGVIINQYKRMCTIRARKIDPGFAWQSRYYDHIIRDDNSLENITNYIDNNPANWINDENFIQCTGTVQ